MDFCVHFFCGNKFWRYKIIKNQTQINEEIRFPQVRLVGTAGEQLGIMSSAEALSVAEDAGLDLVLISPNANPPVCRVMNYGKYKFEQAKRLKEQRKAQKVTEIKEIRLSVVIDKHDIEFKSKDAVRFLSAGDKVKVSIRMRGRQQARPELGVEVMNAFAENIQDVCVVEKAPEIMGRNIFMILAPKTEKK